MIERTAEGKIHTTDWEDVQYRFGNKVGAYVNRESEILDQQEREKEPDSFPVYDPVRERQIERTTDSEESDTELERIREKTRRELKASRKTLAHIEKTDYAHYRTAVTERSMQRNVLLVIYKEQDGECAKILGMLDALANDELQTISIVCITVEEARVSMGPSQLPCVVFYSKGTVIDTVYGSAVWGGALMDENSVLELIIREGFVKCE